MISNNNFYASSDIKWQDDPYSGLSSKRFITHFEDIKATFRLVSPTNCPEAEQEFGKNFDILSRIVEERNRYPKPPKDAPNNYVTFLDGEDKSIRFIHKFFEVRF
jgi:hypothetical protein